MAREGKKTAVTNRLAIMRATEAIFLYIAASLEHKPKGKEHDSRDISAGTKVMLRVLRDVWRVDQRNRQRDGPDPKHLKDPEPKKGEEAIALVVETIVATCAQDAEEEEAREANGPDNDEEGGDELAGVMVAAHGERHDGEDGKVGAPCEIYRIKSQPCQLYFLLEDWRVPVSLSNLNE